MRINNHGASNDKGNKISKIMNKWIQLILVDYRKLIYLIDYNFVN